MTKASVLLSDIRSGNSDGQLLKIYSKENLSAQKQRYIKTIEEYISLFGDDEVVVISAPGRSEVCGNHTDHQNGKVVATAVDIDKIAIASPTNNNIVTQKTHGHETIKITTDDLTPDPKEYFTGTALVKGVLSGLTNRGYKIGGFNSVVDSEVPGGSGLSSSASFEMLIGGIVNTLFNDSCLDAVTLSVCGQYAENEFFGKKSGLMDQLACAVGGALYIDFKTTGSPAIEKLNLNISQNGYHLCIVEVGASHSKLGNQYSKITEEMIGIANELGKNLLSQVSPSDFYAKIPALREKFGERAVLRAIHFLDDVDRVDRLKNAIGKNDFNSILEIITDSGNSSFKYLQNIYVDEKSQPMALALALGEKILGTKGATRVHGGGFAGTVQAFVPDELLDKYKTTMESVFGTDSCRVLNIRQVGVEKVM